MGGNSVSNRALTKFLMSEHMLEIEVGRHLRQPNSHRFCRACQKAGSGDIIGDEKHALTDCVRCWVAKMDGVIELLFVLGDAEVTSHDEATLYELMPYIARILRKSLLFFLQVRQLRSATMVFSTHQSTLIRIMPRQLPELEIEAQARTCFKGLFQTEHHALLELPLKNYNVRGFPPHTQEI